MGLLRKSGSSAGTANFSESFAFCRSQGEIIHLLRIRERDDRSRPPALFTGLRGRSGMRSWLPRRKSGFRIIGRRHEDADSRTFRITDLKCPVAPWQKLRAMHDVSVIFQPFEGGVYVVHHKFQNSGAVGAWLCAARAEQRHGFRTTDCQRARRSDRLGHAFGSGRRAGKAGVCSTPSMTVSTEASRRSSPST